jgi:ElaB/YqjD/DUF883 family membrane-anchored ribosome-binding protein
MPTAPKEKTMTDVQVAREKLLQDFNEVVTDTEQLLKSVTSVGGEKSQALRASVEQNLKAAKERLHEIQQAATQRTQAAARVTDEYVHKNPWQSIGVAAGIAAILGIVIGLLLNRR